MNFTWTVLFSLVIFDNLHARAVNCCRTVRQNCKGMQQVLMTLKLKCWSERCLDSSDLERCRPPEEDSCDGYGSAHDLELLKTVQHMG